MFSSKFLKSLHHTNLNTAKISMTWQLLKTFHSKLLFIQRHYQRYALKVQLPHPYAVCSFPFFSTIQNLR